MRSKRTALAAAAFLAGVLLLLSGLEAAFAQPVITARLRAVPENFSGNCPAKIQFDGVIIVRNNTRPPLRVQYRFLRSDGALSPISTMVFDGNGSKNVSTSWTPGEPSLPAYSGWQSIKILYPREAESNKASFSIACRAEPPKKPDLVIRSFGLKEWGKCEPNHVIFAFQVTVANIGTAASPAIPGKALVQAMDQHGNGWGNGVPLNAIPPGGHQTVMIPVYYLKNDPGHITGVAPHPFRAIADPLKLVDELREDNKLSGVINVDPQEPLRNRFRSRNGPAPEGRLHLLQPGHSPGAIRRQRLEDRRRQPLDVQFRQQGRRGPPGPRRNKEIRFHQVVLCGAAPGELPVYEEIVFGMYTVF